MSIGIEILIDLIDESDESAEYSYYTKGNQAGLVRLDKQSGNVELKSPSSDENTDQTMFHRVAFKLRKHWKAGEIPKSTGWAA